MSNKKSAAKRDGNSLKRQRTNNMDYLQDTTNNDFCQRQTNDEKLADSIVSTLFLKKMRVDVLDSFAGWRKVKPGRRHAWFWQAPYTVRFHCENKTIVDNILAGVL